MNKHTGPAPYPDPSRSRRFLVLVWPLFALAVCIALWVLTLMRVEAEQASIAAQARKDVAAYAEAY